MTEVEIKTEVVAKAKRRPASRPAEYKLRILRELDEYKGTEGHGRNWARIRDSSGNEGFIDEKTRGIKV
mgnify:CR=1 FL=1